jgi:pimeloyl-ACP methyl ester carboxylesterase
MTPRTFYRTKTVNGRKIFYREAGDRAAPTILLLHGLPTSSQMFRDLMPMLADRFHLLAPDYVGFGHSDAPPRDDFQYTFDNLAAHVAGLINALRLESYILYMQDYGGPIGFRLFAERPHQVNGFIIQNANAYVEGVGDAPKQALGPLWEKRAPETEKPARDFVSLEGTKFHWLVGAKDPEAIKASRRPARLLKGAGRPDHGFRRLPGQPAISHARQSGRRQSGCAVPDGLPPPSPSQDPGADDCPRSEGRAPTSRRGLRRPDIAGSWSADSP